MKRRSGSIIDSTIEILIVLSIVGIVAGILIPNFIEFQRRQRHGPCVEWRNTGAFECYGSNTYRRCEQEKVCVRYKDGTEGP